MGEVIEENLVENGKLAVHR